MFKKVSIFATVLIAMFLMASISNATPVQSFVNEDQFVDSRYPTLTSPLNHPFGEYLWSGNQAGGIHAYTLLNFIIDDSWSGKDVQLNLPFNSFLGDAGATSIWFNPNDAWVGQNVTYNTLDTAWDYEAPILLISKFIPSDQGDFLRVSFDLSNLFDFETNNSVSLVVGSILPDEVVGGDYWRDIANSDYPYGSCAPKLVGQDPMNAPVPEPATMLLFGTGLVGLAGAKFRGKKKLPKA